MQEFMGRWLKRGRALLETARITEESLADRREFIRLTPDDLAVLARLAPWADRMADRIARRFYDWQFSFPATRRFFERYAEWRRMPLAEVRNRLEQTQAAYLRSIFQTARSGAFGLDYFATRLNIGLMHNDIDLPLKWYIGSYVLLQDLVREELRRSFWFRPQFRQRAERAIATVFNLDMQAVVESFFLAFVQSTRLNLSSIDVRDRHEDLSEQLSQLRSSLSEAIDRLTEDAVGTARVADDLGSAASTLNAVAEQVARLSTDLAASFERHEELIGQVATAHEEISQAAGGIATGAAEQDRAVTRLSQAMERLAKELAEIAGLAHQSAEGSTQALRQAETGGKVMTETIARFRAVAEALRELSVRVQQMTTLAGQVQQMGQAIEGVAEQTNLLALNAAIEAARAGEAGKGFAVVAEEVRRLAVRAKEATGQILDLVEHITGAIDQAASAAHQGAQTAERGLALASDAETAVRGITGAVRALHQDSLTIAERVQDLRSLGESATSSLDRVSTVTREHAAAAEELNLTMRGVHERWKELEERLRADTGTVEQLARTSDALAATVGEMSELTHTMEEISAALARASQPFSVRSESQLDGRAAHGAQRSLPNARTRDRLVSGAREVVHSGTR
jgi:methyl-accepting chemotaxis protein